GVVLKEQIALGQRIEHVEVEGWDGRQWRRLARADSVGYQRILRFDRFLAERVRISVTRSRGRPLLAAACLLSAGSPRGVTA
ncbi:MAG: hypothetical protein KIT69_06530, partial [Propionibacteriaceae bacterium]|nr:hypothetical protein [Propionibacteriaceae bacterium]